ncbi:MAG: STAS domain-containing protein [Gammaproteobacteria bacterium]|nr:STAS domain-containing protein [Gammaproteobacteria bacterium]MBU1601151.1 STAS domain-containing protein [Gammaproteobacteria bacterium]MBU2434510.1 STAS domain-containing protein [Gammaproteobacteria bacterium]MBU2450914.1 STAS domain-containing protein [Gammaproteobacteria bacterium]
MIELDAGRLVVKVPLVMANARGLLEAGRSALQPGEQVFDFSEVTEADSSALAVMLGWLRAATLSRSTVKFAHIPNGVVSLAELYGVTELLPLA